MLFAIAELDSQSWLFITTFVAIIGLIHPISYLASRLRPTAQSGGSKNQDLDRVQTGCLSDKMPLEPDQLLRVGIEDYRYHRAMQ